MPGVISKFFTWSTKEEICRHKNMAGSLGSYIWDPILTNFDYLGVRINHSIVIARLQG